MTNHTKNTPAMGNSLYRELNAILHNIHDRADTIALFAKHALSRSDSPDGQAVFVENILQSFAYLQSDLTALRSNGAATHETYTDLSGKIISVETLDWLEDGTYWVNDEDEDFDEDGRENAVGFHCSRYSIGVDADGDGISVWLNGDMEEVEA
jgi:hypothetical protein